MADEFNIYKDIATRTNGDIYIGVVGPVRTGKSTFIKNFMDMLIIPNIESEYERSRTTDELPQSSNGKTIMTTEPKFIPKEAVNVTFENNVSFRAKVIDCVGYMVPGAIGHIEEDHERMVKTPWSREEIPFTEAAELGTKRVISEHSTVGIVMTTDGTITELGRDNYVGAEERVIKELKELGKPFVVVLNCSKPYSDEAKALNRELEDKYDVPIVNVNCKQLRMDDINEITEQLLQEFPLKEIQVALPKWTECLDNSHWVKSQMIEMVKNNMDDILKLKDINEYVNMFDDYDIVKKVHIDSIDMATGLSKIEIMLSDHLFYDVLSETTGIEVHNERKLISLMRKLVNAKSEYEKVSSAMTDVMSRGYGIVNPLMDQLKLEEPQIVKQGAKFGVKIKATAPSIHFIKTDILTEINPFVGTEQQSQDFIAYFKDEMTSNPQKIWDSEIFGKSLYELVNDGLNTKLVKMPEDSQMKLQQTLQRVINEGNGGLICIIL